MQEGPSATAEVDGGCPDSGVSCLVVLARYHNIAASSEQLVHEFSTPGTVFGKTELLLAAKKLGLKARLVNCRPERLGHTPLPAIACSKDGDFFILARLDGDKALIH
ncbi:type I secretion system permease/ATPase, partial [Pseudomonas aeruginosa]|nr:type I secretion system permease/ATPase [Pseudomonas aeruginosa]